MSATRILRILGTRGIPAAHGGFETFAEHLALYLVEHGWQVTVYCQEDGPGPVFEDTWKGVRRVRMPVVNGGVVGTIVFDWKSTLHASREKGPILTLGYNTAVFCVVYRLKGLANVINMDGIEWRRQKWGTIAKAWFWLNDWAGCLLGNHLVADHPEIKKHLQTRVDGKKIGTIAYGADAVITADASILKTYGLTENGYAILIARAEPENSIIDIVKAWSRRYRGVKLVVLGKYDFSHAYQHAARSAAGPEVVFLGAIYEKPVVQALRFFARFYVHGHQVGGTNPSLVESLGAGNAILAHDNPYNRWVAGGGGLYFSGVDDCAAKIDHLLGDAEFLARLKAASRLQHTEHFTWPQILAEYKLLLSGWADATSFNRSSPHLDQRRDINFGPDRMALADSPNRALAGVVERRANREHPAALAHETTASKRTLTSANVAENPVDQHQLLQPLRLMGVAENPIGRPSADADADADTAAVATVLVLGATGFIGQALVSRLRRDGVRVRALVRRTSGAAALLAQQGVEVVKGDFTDAAVVDAALDGVESVYHLARGSGRDWADYQAFDVEPTHRLAERCAQRGIGLFYTSSIAIYDGGRIGEVINESTPPSRASMRLNAYARAKVANERLLAQMHRDMGLKVVVFRLGIVIGKGGSPHHPGVGTWPSAAVCRPWGGGQHCLPFVLVEDCAEAMVRALHKPGIDGESFNLVGEPCLSGNQYLDALEQAGGAKINRPAMPAWRLFAQSVAKWGYQTLIQSPDRRLPSYRYFEGLSNRATYSSALAEQRLGWRPAGAAVLIEMGISLPVTGTADRPNV